MAKPVVSLKLDDLIDKQVKLWEVRRRLAEEGGSVARKELVHLEYGPWLSISRQIGSGGGSLARRVADRLGWQVFGREMLAAIAEQAHTRRRILSRLDEKAVSGLSEIINHLLAPESLSQGAFIRELMEVMIAIARQGRAVVLGRGANWVLEPGFGLRVRVVAPLEKRVETVAARKGINHGEARKLVLRMDDQKSAFIRQVYGKNIDDTLGYDLVVNTGSIDETAAENIVIAALHRKLE